MAEYGEPLSKREIEVLELVTTGATNRQIAQELVVSVNTVKVHLRNIFTKLGVESRTEATLTAIREGLVSVQDAPAEAESLEPDTPSYAADGTATSSDGLSTTVPDETLPPLPWPKRVALVASLLLVALVTVATWPSSQSDASRSSDETDNPVNGSGGVGVAGVSTGWRALAPMTIARSRFALATLPDDQLFAIGGETSGGITGAAERYDSIRDQWTPLPASKPTRVSNMGAVAIGAWVYVPGGLTAEGQPTSLVEAYSLVDETWKQVTPLPRPLASYAIAKYDGALYLFGGKDDRGYSNATLTYDPAQDKWHEGKAMPSRRAYAAAATLGRTIFVTGGYDGENEQSTCEVYRPLNDTWEGCEPLTLGRGGLGLAAVANRLYAVGGGWSTNLWFSERFDPSAEDWTPFETPVTQQWRNLAIASTPAKFFVAGGWNGDYLNGVWEYVVLSHRIFIPAASP